MPKPVHGQYLLFDGSKNLGQGSFQPQTWLIKPDGTGSKLIASGYASGPMSPQRFNIDAVWSHDGSVIHILRYPIENSNVCVPHLSDIAVGGGPEVPKVTLTNHDGNFLWSPDDTRIAYRHYHEDEICEQNGLSMVNDLVIMNADGTGKHTVRTNFAYRVTAWMPDGSALLAVNDYDEWQKVNLVDGSVTPLNLHATRVEVSPNGAQVAYLESNHLWVRQLSGGTAKDFGAATDFAWAPTTPTLAICGSSLSERSSNTGVGLVLYPGTGSSPSWSPDGKRIAFRKSSGWIFVVPAIGGTVASMPGTSTASHVSWQP